jgi:hypothetical protein
VIYIRFSSHRAREYGLRALDRKPQAYWSLKRRTGPGGVYLVTEDEARAMRAYSGHARFTRLRGPFEDLWECWS